MYVKTIVGVKKIYYTFTKKFIQLLNTNFFWKREQKLSEKGRKCFFYKSLSIFQKQAHIDRGECKFVKNEHFKVSKLRSKRPD